MALLDPEVRKLYVQQQRAAAMRNIGAGLLAAAAQGRGLGPGLAHGLSQAGPGPSLPDMLKLSQLQREQQQDETRQSQYSKLVGGLDPKTGIEWRAGRQTSGVGAPEALAAGGGPTPQAQGLLGAPSGLLEGTTPAQRSLLQAMGPEKGTSLLAKRAFAEPRNLKASDFVKVPGPEGPIYLPAEQAEGRRVYEKSEPQYTGEVLFDKQVGKFYQTNPKTQKREYVAPNEEFLIEETADGLRIRKGPSGTGTTRATTTKIEGKILDAREGLARLSVIKSQFKPEYQEIPTRLGVAWSGLKARFGQGNVSPEEQQSVAEFADYRRNAIGNINLYIKEITGAQMGEREADRLRLAMPDPGEGIFGGDDPISFKSKVDSTIRDLEKAAIRFEHYRAKGISDPEEMARLSPLSGMRIAVNPESGERIIEVDGQWIPMQ